jgi:hypothetical protein
MFRIKNAVSTHVQQRNSVSESLPQQAPFIKEDEVVLNFSGGESAIVNRDQLAEHFTGLIIPPDAKELNLTRLSRKWFNALKAVVVEKRQLHEILTDVDYRDPFLYENLVDCVHMLNMKGGDELLKTIRNTQLDFLNLKQAVAIMTGFAEAQRAQVSRLQQIPRPYAVIQADLMLCRSRLFFNSDKEADELFQSRQICNKELRLCEFLLMDLKEALKNPKNEMHKIFLHLQIKNLSRQIQFCQKTLENFQKKLSVQGMSCALLQRMQNYSHDESEFVRETVQLAKKELDVYRETMLKALDKNGANMKRHDLIEWIVGPKGFLLDYYGLKYDPDERPEYPFTNRHSNFGYRLDREGPYDLETEIRSDLSIYQRADNLPPRLIKIDEKTKEITPEVKAILDKIMPFLKKFPTPETQVGTDAHQEVVTMLWTFNGWDKMGVDPKKITLDEIDRKHDPFVIKGFVTVRNETRPFHCFADDLIMICKRHDNHSTADRVSTREWIEGHSGGSHSIIFGNFVYLPNNA